MKIIFASISISASLAACAAQPRRPANAITPQSLPALQDVKLVDVAKHCEPTSKMYGCHGEVEKALEILMQNGPLRCHRVSAQRSRCKIGDLDLVEAMLLSGNATVLRGVVNPRYQRAQQIAARAKAGIWSSLDGIIYIYPPIETIEAGKPQP